MPHKNREDRAMYSQRYYQEHKEQIQARRKGSIFCEVCHKDVSKTNFTKHARRRGHILADKTFKVNRLIGIELKRKTQSDIADAITSFL
jgi:hypothetical protein